MKLYEIAKDYQKALDFVSSGIEVEIVKDGKLMEFDLPGSLNLELEAIKESFEDKCIAVAKYIKNLESHALAIDKAIDDMTVRRKRISKNASSLHDYLKYNIEKVGLADSITCPWFDIKLKTNPPSLVILDESVIPPMFIKEKLVKSIDKIAIKKEIQDGFDVEGCRIERTKTLVIK